READREPCTAPRSKSPPSALSAFSRVYRAQRSRSVVSITDRRQCLASLRLPRKKAPAMANDAEMRPIPPTAPATRAATAAARCMRRRRSVSANSRPLATQTEVSAFLHHPDLDGEADMARHDPYQGRARELAREAGLDPDGRIERPGNRSMPVWCTFREAARKEHLAQETVELTSAIAAEKPQSPQFQDSPLKIFGQHDEATVAQM